MTRRARFDLRVVARGALEVRNVGVFGEYPASRTRFDERAVEPEIGRARRLAAARLRPGDVARVFAVTRFAAHVDVRILRLVLVARSIVSKHDTGRVTDRTHRVP